MSVKKLSRYDLVAVIAQGKLGPVWEGFDPDIRRKVTIKVAPVEHLSQEAADALVARFRAEARVAGKLVHPNIVGVYDAGVESGLAFIVAETVTGATLDAMLRQPAGVPAEGVGRVMLQVLAALDHAHSKGVAHLGLQPLQVLVAPNGSVKVADFGAVAAAEPDDSTRAQGSLSEHIRCLAPEQVLGLEADARADLWAAGVMLYRLWTGHWPFHADSDFGLIQQIIKQPPAAPSTRVPARVPPLGAEHDQLIARALAKSAADRYPSAREFAADLSRIVAREAASGTLGGTAAGRAAVLSAVTAAVPPPVPAPPPPPTPPAAPPPPLPTIAVPATDAAQAEELAHWQRIQASDVPADFDAFLVRYPSGACANLARRRLRRLAGGDDSTPGAAPAALPPAVSKARRKGPRTDVAEAPAPKRGWMVALGALIVLGAAATFMLKRGAPVEVASPVPVPPASAAVAVAPPAVAPVASAVEPVASAPVIAAPVAATASPVVPAAAPSAPTVAAPTAKALTPREAAAARKAADAKAKGKPGGALPSVAEPVARPADDERQRAPAPVAEAPKPVEPPASVAPAAPSEPCGKRVFVARLSCLKDACGKPEWAKHPQCVEFRRMEESRQRGEQQN